MSPARPSGLSRSSPLRAHRYATVWGFASPENDLPERLLCPSMPKTSLPGEPEARPEALVNRTLVLGSKECSSGGNRDTKPVRS
jgi:hypothetical protein